MAVKELSVTVNSRKKWKRNCEPSLVLLLRSTVISIQSFARVHWEFLFLPHPNEDICTRNYRPQCSHSFKWCVTNFYMQYQLLELRSSQQWLWRVLSFQSGRSSPVSQRNILPLSLQLKSKSNKTCSFLGTCLCCSLTLKMEAIYSLKN